MSLSIEMEWGSNTPIFQSGNPKGKPQKRIHLENEPHWVLQ